MNHNRVSRNDPCPCGSGKKYKHCCLPKQVAAHRPRPLPTITDPYGNPKKRPEYPIGTVALYGPNDSITTKIVGNNLGGHHFCSEVGPGWNMWVSMKWCPFTSPPIFSREST